MGFKIIIHYHLHQSHLLYIPHSPRRADNTFQIPPPYAPSKSPLSPQVPSESHTFVHNKRLGREVPLQYPKQYLKQSSWKDSYEYILLTSWIYLYMYVSIFMSDFILFPPKPYFYFNFNWDKLFLPLHTCNKNHRIQPSWRQDHYDF